jgi:hypothetical protein
MGERLGFSLIFPSLDHSVRRAAGCYSPGSVRVKSIDKGPQSPLKQSLAQLGAVCLLRMSVSLALFSNPPNME